MVGHAPAWSGVENGRKGTKARIGRWSPHRLSAAESGYDSFRVMKGIALGCALSVPVWVAIGLAVSALVS